MLEQFNLPPNVIKFIRKNLKIINAALALVVILTLSWSAYDAYRQKRINTSSSALSMAMKEPEVVSLRRAAEGHCRFFRHVFSALGHGGACPYRYEKRRISRRQPRNIPESEQKIKSKDPLFGLVSFGIAQAEEAGKEYDRAFGEYQALSKIEGYQAIGLLGMGRIHEIKGETEKALSDL